MYIQRLIPFTILLLFVCGQTGQAGVYWPAEQKEEILSPVYGLFHETLLKFKLLRFKSNQVPNITGSNFFTFQANTTARLLPLTRPDSMTAEDFLNVSAFLLHLGNYGEAIEVLKKGQTVFPDNPLILSNLGAAYQHAAEMEKEGYKWDLAFLSLRNADKKWPKRFMDLTPEQAAFFQQIGWGEEVTPQLLTGTGGLIASSLGQGPLLSTAYLFTGFSTPKYDFYRLAESYHLKLVENRRTEKGSIDSVDPLFGKKTAPLKFVGPSGQYEPGKLANAELKKLPDQSVDKAIAIVEQLLIWLPNDNRLYWQLGELLNASGNSTTAKEIFEYLVQNPINPARYKELMKHRQVLVFQHPSAPPNQEKTETVKAPPPPPKNEDDKKNQADTPENWTERWQFFGVGFGVGAVIALFGYWQIRQFSRRGPRRTVSTGTPR